MENLSIDQTFPLIKPYCDELMKYPSADNAIKVTELVGKCSNIVIQNLTEYILFPIKTHLHNPDVSKDVKQHLLDAMRAVISKSRIMKINTFNNLFVCAISQIFNPKKSEMLLQSHEELKESVTLCMKCLIERCTTDVLESIYTFKNTLILSNGIYLCVLIARTEKSRSLRITAIETVMSLMQVHDKVDTADTVFQCQVADMIMVILPGVAKGLLEIAKGSDIQGHKLTMVAIRAWSKIIALVMEDSADIETEPDLDFLCKKSKVIPPNKSSISVNFQKPDEMKTFSESAKRTPEWFQFSGEKLSIHMNELDDLLSHSHFRVRKELAAGMNLILTKCSRNMKPSFSKMVEILITLSEDDSPEVVGVAKHGLNAVSVKCSQERGMESLNELFEDNFYKLLTTLPRIMRTADDSMQLSYLHQLTAYIKLLGKQRLPHVMLSAIHLQRLIFSLVYVVELEYNGISILEDFSATRIDDVVQYSNMRSWRQYKFINSSFIENKLMAVCKLLGELGDFEVLVDTLLKLIFDMQQYRKELTLLLNWIVKVPFTDTRIISLYTQIIDQYTSHEVWYLPIEVSKETTLREAQSNLTQCCLLVEGLGSIAQVLKKDYDAFLLKTLYLVLERAGSGHSLLRIAGLEALEKITKSQYSSISELLRRNVDYISYHVTLKLRRVKRNPGVLDVLGVVMEFSTIDFLPCLKEIVNDVLRQSSEKAQKDDAYSFLRVFYTFAKCVRRLTSKGERKVEKEVIKEESSMETVIREVVEYYEAKQITAKFEDLNNDVDKPISEEEIEQGMKSYSDNDYIEEEKLLEIPQYVKMIEEVMKRCLHFLPSKDFTVSTLAMSTLTEGLIILCDWESQLLPIVHQTWHPLVNRFCDPNPTVINRAWQLLQTLAIVSKDFIRSRTLKEVLPFISDFLTKAAKESYKKDSGSVYSFTQTFKLQKELLSQLGQVAKHLQLQERQLWDILEICEPYLSTLQHKTLQESCIALYQEFADYNSDIVWVKCLAIWDQQVEQVGRIPFETWYSKIADSEARSEYRKSVQIILNYIKSKNNL